MAAYQVIRRNGNNRFQHTATRRWLPVCQHHALSNLRFQHTATRRWLPKVPPVDLPKRDVSTHSHPKVAAILITASGSRLTFQHTATRRWLLFHIQFSPYCQEFQHTATRRWLLLEIQNHYDYKIVSTHSHPKVAALP